MRENKFLDNFLLIHAQIPSSNVFMDRRKTCPTLDTGKQQKVTIHLNIVIK